MTHSNSDNDEAGTQARAYQPERLVDNHGRVIHDLRVSVTDRCNYKCVYCRTGETGIPADRTSFVGWEIGAHYPELAIEEYLRLIRVFVTLGITKVRLTGGEPLLRRGLVELIQELAGMRLLNGEPLELALTTNGHLLKRLAAPLKAAGLQRVTVSMDAVEAATFERVTRVPGSFAAVLAGIRAAREAGLEPLKINCVLLRGFNDDQIEGFAEFARRERVVVRFIEFMPLEEGRIWTPEIVVPQKEILQRIGRVLPLVELPPREASETARRYTFADGVGEIGIIAPVSQAFCGACSRVRLTSDGKIRTCLFSQVEHDLYGRLRAGASDGELAAYIIRTIEGKEARHHIGEPGFLKPSRSMVHIGG
ncbi:MAG: GTP 3',8-cyclase MoaA [Terracidiphilus sp.]|jgi:cyclic pyranopterin phosphate synthase